MTQVVRCPFEEEIKEYDKNASLNRINQDILILKQQQPQDPQQEFQLIQIEENEIDGSQRVNVQMQSIIHENLIKTDYLPVIKNEIEYEFFQNQRNEEEDERQNAVEQKSTLNYNDYLKERINLLCQNDNHLQIDDLLTESSSDEEKNLILQTLLQLPEQQILAYQNQTQILKNDKKFQQNAIMLRAFIKEKKWDSCNKKLSDYYSLDSYKAKFLYVTQLRNYSEITPLVKPLIQIQQDPISELMKIECPDSVKEILNQLISQFKDKQYEDAIELLDSIKEINEAYFQKISPLLKRISNVFFQGVSLDSYKIEQEGSVQYDNNSQQFLSFLQEKKYKKARDLLWNIEDIDEAVRFAHCQNPHITETFFKETFLQDEFETEIKIIQNLLRDDKIDQVNNKIMKLHQRNQAKSFSIYFYFKQNNIKISHPVFIFQHLNSQKIDSLKSIHPKSIKTNSIYQKFISAISENDFQEGLLLLEVIWDYDSEFILQEQTNLKEISQDINKFLEVKLSEFTIKSKLNTESKFYMDYVQICQYLGRNEITQARNIFNNILLSQDQEILKFYTCLKENEFQSIQLSDCISEQNIFESVSPMQVKHHVLNILKEIKQGNEESKDSEVQKKQIKLEDLLNQIYWDDPHFYKIFVSYIRLKQDIPTYLKEKLKQIKCLDKNDICQEDLKNFSIQMPNLEKQLNVIDFMAINVYQTSEKLKEIFVEKIKIDGELDRELLIQILFDLIKKKISFESIIQELREVHPQKIFTQNLLLNYLFENSDRHLKTLLIQSCSYFLPLPLLTYSITDGNMQRVMHPELYYIYEQCLGIFSFKFSTNPNKTIKRCSKILNDAFSKTFELHQNNYSNYGTISIQFDFNFSKPCYMPVVDVQGILDIDIVRKFYSYFDVFIIHYSKKEREDLEQEIIKIKERNSSSQIICIEHSDEYVKEYTLHSQNIFNHKFLECNFDIMEDLKYQNLIKQLRNIVLSVLQNKEQQSKYESHIFLRQSQNQSYIDLLRDFKINVSILEESHKLISSILSEVCENKQNLHSESFLPMNFYFQYLCEANNDIQKDAKTQQEIKLIKEKIEQLKKQLKIWRPSKIINIMQQISKSQNYLGNMNVVSKLIKGYIENELNPLYQERTYVRLEIQQQKLSIEEKEMKINQIFELSQRIQTKWFSQEFIIREFYLRYRFNETNLQEKQDFETLIFNQYQQAQPFEIIDGNNLSFIQEVYEKQFKEDSEKILVVSIIGPQSSGKSLLLNFLFGTQFQSAAGRCTKGVYGSIMKIKGVGENSYQKILLLDTEGIQSSEVRDERFDKRIVFYILCISHIVLICNKGEMNSQMSDIIKLASDSISVLRESVQKEPQVNIIMNMLTEIDNVALQQSIQSVSNSLIMGENKETINKIFQINEENIFTLPFAFNRSGNERLVVNQPSFEFAKQIEPLKNKIFNKILMGDQEGSIYNIKEWFKFASGFWEFTQDFEGITQYSTLEQKKQDKQLLEFKQALVQREFYDKQNSNFLLIEAQVEQFYKSLDFSEQHQVQKNKKSIHLLIENKFQQELDHVEKQFLDYCKENKINEKIVNKKTNQLSNELRSILADFKSFACRNYAILLNLKSHIMTDESFQQYINKCLRIKDRYNEDEAKFQYKKYYKKIEEKYQRLNENKEDIEQEQFKLIRQYYKNQFPEKNMQKKNEEIEILQAFSQSQNQYKAFFLTLIKQKCQHNFLYNINDTVRPNMERIQRFLQDCNKQYLTRLNQNWIKKVSTKNYFNLKQFIQERVHVENLFKDILNSVKNKKTLGIVEKNPFYRRKTDFNKLDDIIRNFESDAKQYQINCKGFIEYIRDIEYYLQKIQIQNYSTENEQWDSKNKTIKRNLTILLNKIFEFPKDYFSFDSKISPKIIGLTQSSYILNKEIRKFPYMIFKDKCYKNQEAYNIFKYVIKENDFNELDDQKQKEFEIYSNEVKILIDYPEANEDVRNYFQFLSDPSLNRLNKNSKSISEGISYFFNQLDLEIIIDDIEKIVLQEFVRLENGNLLNFFERIELLRKTKDVEQYCSVSNKVIQRIATSVYNLINKIDNVLEIFCFKISEYGCSQLHLIAQTFITVIVQEIEIIKNQAFLTKFQENSRNQELIFIAKLTSNDKDQDQAIARQVSDLLIQDIKQIQSIFSQKNFEKEVKNYVAEFEKVNVIKNLEDQILLQKDKFDIESKVDLNGQKFEFEQLIKLYLNPKKLLSELFEKQWNETLMPVVQQLQIKYSKKILKRIEEIIFMATKLKNKMEKNKSNIDSNSIFMNKQYYESNYLTTPNPDNRDEITEKITNDQKQGILQKVASKYFLLYLQGKWSNESVIQVEEKVFVILNKVNMPRSQKPKLKNQNIINVFNDGLKDGRISSIHYFCQELIEIMENYKKRDYQISVHFIVQDFQLDLRHQFLGCEAFCPLCRKQCDQIHKINASEIIHICQNGHRIISFGGTKLNKTNKAIPISCDQIKDTDEIFYKDQIVNWKDVKSDLNQKQWNFILNKTQLSQINQREKKLWDIIGPQICKYYTEQEGNEIIYEPVNELKNPLIQNTHFILMLDGSSSMSTYHFSLLSNLYYYMGYQNTSPWQDLMNAVQKFLQTLQQNPNYANNSKVSSLVYNTKSKISFRNQVPDISLVEQIKYLGGDTNFSAPLADAYSLMQDTFQEFDKFILCLMTDGKAKYPEKEVNNFKQNLEFQNKLQFQAIFFGSSSTPENLEKIVKELNGTVKAVIEPHNLMFAFNQLVPNIYQ